MSDSTDTADLKKQLEAAIASYHKALENVRAFRREIARGPTGGGHSGERRLRG